MPIRRHGKGWEVRVQHAGRRLSQTVVARSDALALERRWRDEIESGKVGRIPRVSLEDALARWLTEEASRLKSSRDLTNKVRAIFPQVQGKALSEVVDAAQAVKLAGQEQGLAPATVNRRLAILRRVANLAREQWGWLDADLGKRIKLVPGEKPRHIYLTPAEVKRLARAAGTGPGRAILLAAMSGLRRTELLGLGPENRVDGALALTETKNGRPRVVPLPPEAARIQLPLGVTDQQLRDGFERARKAIGRPDLHFHDLRHTYASWLVQGGASLVAVRDLLGHSSLSVTSRYAHLGTEHLKAAIGGLPGIARGIRGAQKKRVSRK